ncbi:hypothetical protein MRB53_023580 [Persea americana]|uniref:Uncharacterized protein n=1 Tax=Persea americana TaxID=3435 RepID=A0ACC2LAY1_PERAE|nr:hypothetical protein MRB53_023580 [Persea americana]
MYGVVTAIQCRPYCTLRSHQADPPKLLPSPPPRVSTVDPVDPALGRSTAYTVYPVDRAPGRSTAYTAPLSTCKKQVDILLCARSTEPCAGRPAAVSEKGEIVFSSGSREPDAVSPVDRAAGRSTGYTTVTEHRFCN